MITELAVRDLGVFESARLVLGEGFTALTGETGAGKSLVIGAIQLLLGARADASLVRPGAHEAVVDGRFVSEDGSEVVLSRVVPVEGRSRAYIDGRPVTVTDLAERGAVLVELHGQHAHQQLLQAAAQRSALDRFAGVDLTALHLARRSLAEIDAQLAALGGDERARAREIDLLTYQLDELDAAGLDEPDEDARLDREEDLLADASTHRDRAEAAVGVLTDDDGVVHQLEAVIGRLDGASPFRDHVTRLRAASAELSDVSRDMRTAAESITDDPERLSEIRERRQLLADLRRKYGATLEEVIREREAVRARLEELAGHEARVAELGGLRAEAEAAVSAESAKVAEARRAAAPLLAAGVQERLRVLAMPDAEVEVAVEGPDPADEVVFRLAANRGAPAGPMARVASGGELSRATLALRLELTAGPSTLVFDEVDAGIGGETAWAVGAALAALTPRHQVLVVTHLAQVAAFAQQHVQVRKEAEAGATVACVRSLGDDDRVAELARMLSGRPDSESGRAHAEELLVAASKAGAR